MLLSHQLYYSYPEIYRQTSTLAWWLWLYEWSIKQRSQTHSDGKRSTWPTHIKYVAYEATIRCINDLPATPDEEYPVWMKSLFQINDKLQRYLIFHKKDEAVDIFDTVNHNFEISNLYCSHNCPIAGISKVQDLHSNRNISKLRI